jgi:hypothetical protein
MKISNIIFIVSLLFVSYCAYDFYKKKSDKGTLTNKQRNINKINPSVVNINSIQEGDIEPDYSREIRAKLPILDNFFNEENINQWRNYLTEEDFRILRELRSVLESRMFFSKQDEIKVEALKKKNIINAIRNNDPSMVIVHSPIPFNPEPAPEEVQDPIIPADIDPQVEESLPEEQPEQQQVDEGQPPEEILDNQEVQPYNNENIEHQLEPMPEESPIDEFF